MKRRAPARWLTALAVLVASPFTPAFAEDRPEDGAPSPTASKSIGERFGFSYTMGYGHGIQMRERTQNSDVADVRMLLFMPHVRFEVVDWTPRQRWYAGRFDLVVEPELAINFEPTTGVGGGITGGLRYRIFADRTWSPYFHGTLGFGAINFDLESQADAFSFWLIGGFGVRRALRDDFALTTDVRLYHISNAALTPPNDGIDAITFTLGFEYR